MSSANLVTPQEVKRQIAQEIARVHVDSYGERASNFDIAVGEEVLTVMMDVEYSPAEETLVAAGRAEAVRAAREAYQEAIAEVFVAIVERATGRRVIGFASRMVIDGPIAWSVEVFRLQPTSTDLAWPTKGR